MKSNWKALYEGQEIRVENSWRKGEKLFVNNQLQDEQCHFMTTENIRLTGHLINTKGEREEIKVNMFTDFFSVKCTLFINDKKIALEKS